MASEIDILVKAVNEASGPLKTISGDLGKVEADSKTTGSAFSTLGNIFKAGAIAAVAGIGGLALALGHTVEIARNSIAVDNQLAAVLESTGGAAGVTAQMANDLAASLQKVTNFDDEAITSGESLLLTFTNIGKDVFPDATKTMLDMSAALGTDLKGSAIQLGKALNDPVAGIGALSRVGVTFNDQQKEMIKTMVEAGDTAGAQKLILAELAKEFGGSAEALADPAIQLGNAWDNFQEVIGRAVLPMLNNLAQTVLPYVEAATQAVGTAIHNFLAYLAEGDSPLEAFKWALYDLMPEGMADKFAAFTDQVAGTFNTIRGTIQTDMGWIKLAWDADWGDIHTTWTTFATDLPNEQARFWDEWHKTFDTGSKANVNDWEGWMGGLGTFAAGWWRLTVENWTVSLALLRGEWQAFSALFKGDWEGTWNGFKLALFSVTDIMLNYIEFVFGPGLRDKLAGALNSTWDILKSWWGNVKSWWDSTIGALTGMTAPAGIMPSFAPVGGASGSGGGAASAQSLGGVNVTQHFYGQADATTVSDASQDGVLRAGRSLGLR